MAVEVHTQRAVVVSLAVMLCGLLTSGSASAHTRADPVQVGKYHRIGQDWRVKTLGSDLKANREIAKENQFNEPPARGYQYIVVTVRGNKLTRGEGNLYFDVDLKLFGSATRRLYSECDQVTPVALGFRDSVLKGGRVTGNMCFEVRKRDISKRLRVRIEDYLASPRAWYRIRPGDARY